MRSGFSLSRIAVMSVIVRGGATKPAGMAPTRPRDTDTAYDVAVRLTAKISGPRVTAAQ